MKNEKKCAKLLVQVGKDEYNFDYEEEKAIYDFLCYRPLGKKQKVNDKHKFVLYSQWEQYICQKYQKVSSEKLKDFSRYLNLRKRQIKPNYESQKILVTIILTVVINTSIDTLFMIYKEKITCIILDIIACIITIIVAFIIALMATQLLDILEIDDVEENFYNDYKEIIDKIIENRKEDK